MKNKGFTLVELLAVIVILAIIMVLSIPSILDTLAVARKKSFTEYIDKIYQTAEGKVSIKEMYGENSTCVMYDITSDLGLDNTGDFKGYIVTALNDEEDDYRYFLTLWDSNYMIYALEYKGTNKGLEILNYDSSKTNELSIDYLTIMSGCSTYTEEKTKEEKVANPSGPVPYPYTGTKTGANGWIAHYTDGVMDDCYHKDQNTFCTGTWASKEPTNYKDDSYPDQIDVCMEHKSLDCCTSSLTEDIPVNYKYVYYYPRTKSCGYGMQSRNGKYAIVYYADAGGGLPESGVTY